MDVRGRSRTLHINYRTSHQIRTQADRLLGSEVSDVDGIREKRRGTVSVFNGPPPEGRILNSPEEEAEFLYARVARTVEHDLPEEIDHLHRHGHARRRIMETVKMPDRLAQNLIMFIRRTTATSRKSAAGTTKWHA